VHGFCGVKLIFYALIISLISYIDNTINKLLFLSGLYLALKNEFDKLLALQKKILV
jgi:hypothetical protein